jgi:hypothetical protein
MTRYVLWDGTITITKKLPHLILSGCTLKMDDKAPTYRAGATGAIRSANLGGWFGFGVHAVGCAGQAQALGSPKDDELGPSFPHTVPATIQTIIMRTQAMMAGIAWPEQGSARSEHMRGTIGTHFSCEWSHAVRSHRRKETPARKVRPATASSDSSRRHRRLMHR